MPLPPWTCEWYKRLCIVHSLQSDGCARQKFLVSFGLFGFVWFGLFVLVCFDLFWFVWACLVGFGFGLCVLVWFVFVLGLREVLLVAFWMVLRF